MRKPVPAAERAEILASATSRNPATPAPAGRQAGDLNTGSCPILTRWRGVVLSCDRRRIVHFGVTSNPSASWAAQQIVNAFPGETAPRFLMRDRDGTFGAVFQARVENMGIEEVVTAARSPWQNPYVERLIGSIRRECLDHVIVLGENHLWRILKSYVAYYNGSRTHLSLAKDAPERRLIERRGQVIALPQVGGLHHRYARRAA
jgi:hypothetical protein